MAAKQQGKKKSRDVKKKPQKKPQKKPLKVKQKQKRSQPQKMKKGQAKLAKAGTSKQEDQICYPRRFAARILRQMPKVRMEGKARMLVKTMLTDMYNHVATQVEATLSQKNEPLDITATDVQAALKEAMTKEMAKHVDEQPPRLPANVSRERGIPPVAGAVRGREPSIDPVEDPQNTRETLAYFAAFLRLLHRHHHLQ